MERKQLVINLGDNKIIAEIDDSNLPEIPPELNVYLCDKNGTWLQDICLVRPHYSYHRIKEEFVIDNDFVDCLVWGNSDNEDFTDDFCIGVYEEDE